MGTAQARMCTCATLASLTPQKRQVSATHRNCLRNMLWDSTLACAGYGDTCRCHMQASKAARAAAEPHQLNLR